MAAPQNLLNSLPLGKDLGTTAKVSLNPSAFAVRSTRFSQSLITKLS
jgi:hypothetical protein